jgi:hypothetical protein
VVPTPRFHPEDDANISLGADGAARARWYGAGEGGNDLEEG